MREVFGDSSRNGGWAAVRLLVDGDRISEADAPGLGRALAGLTLLEAAAVGGETLAADALANALGPGFRAAPAPGRVAVAMSGGVDSAVALLRSGRDAIGVTLRLWLDPDRPDAQRAPCGPAAPRADRVPAGRELEGGGARRGARGGTRGREPRREPGGVLPRRRRLPRLPRAPRPRGGRGADPRRGRRGARPARGLLALHARPAARARRLVGGAALRAPHRAGHEHGRRRPARVARPARRLRPGSPVRPGGARRGEASLPLSGPPGGGRGDRVRVPPAALRAGLRCRARSGGRSLPRRLGGGGGGGLPRRRRCAPLPLAPSLRRRAR